VTTGTGTPQPRLTRLVVVADNSLIVEAIAVGLRRSGEFDLLGHADGRRCSVRPILDAKPDVVLVDEMDEPNRALALVRAIHSDNERIVVLMLTVRMDPEWLRRAFDAGARGVISKAIRPTALSTVVRETFNGHVVHCTPELASANASAADLAIAEDFPLTRRELEILQRVAAGATNSEIARQLWLSEQTVKFHLANIYRKLEVANRTEASHWAHVNGVIQSDGQAPDTGRPAPGRGTGQGARSRAPQPPPAADSALAGAATP
jgi:DNA-binding NarL/FixJ family response regulator